MSTACIQNKEMCVGKSRLNESTRKKVDSVGTTGIFHLIILNTSYEVEGTINSDREEKGSRKERVYRPREDICIIEW